MQDADESPPRRPIKALEMPNRISLADVCFSNGRSDQQREVNEEDEIDCSIFEHLYGNGFEPISFEKPRTRQQQAALTAMLKESIRYLFPTAPSYFQDDIISDSPMCHNKSSTSDETRWNLDISDNSNNDAEERSLKRQRLSVDEYSTLRFRDYQEEAWNNHLQDLLRFKEREGHCSVPYSFPENPGLARWVKRQRFQYKLRLEGKSSSTMTSRRVKVLEDVGFVWDSHFASWEERLGDLQKYRVAHGNCDVPTHYKANKKLATWVKCQRRQYKLFLAGRPSTMNAQRVDVLNRLGFSWEMRSSKKEKPFGS